MTIIAIHTTSIPFITNLGSQYYVQLFNSLFTTRPKNVLRANKYCFR